MKKKFRSNKYWWAASREKIIVLAVLGIFFFITPTKVQHELQASLPVLRSRPAEMLPIPKPAPYPVHTTDVMPADTITAYAVMVIDQLSGVTMYSKNEEEKLAPASTTKLMTAMVALDLYGPEEIVTVKEATLSGQIMDLVVGEKITVENLLYGLLISSANDASYVLAQHHPQGPQGFMDAMNKKAQEIGLQQTFFVNPAGFDDDLHKMTAKDISVMARTALTYPLIAKIVSIPQITVHDVSYTLFHPLRTTNVLLGKIPGVAGIKTGYTKEAGENLVSLTERNGRKIIIVTLRSLDRFGDTENLINWAFSNHQWVEYGI
jgi:serine-type D-Ala-D-Ala carboxypeptidase (penicillin-binding protein 5/6)